MTEKLPENIATWLAEPLSSDVRTSLTRLAQADDVQHVAVMPDVHLAGDVCNGTVLATIELIYPVVVGNDIGCGMLAVACDLPGSALADEVLAGRILNGLYSRVPANKHTPATRPNELPTSLQSNLSCPALDKERTRDGLYQLGTLGRGNHFLELQVDADGRMWLLLHSGSRGMGQAISSFHQRTAPMSSCGLKCLPVESAEGQAYLADLDWAIEYAMQNRLAMAAAVEAILRLLSGAALDWSTLIHCQHNHVRLEAHAGRDLWVHRKGALMAGDTEAGIIPGSMGTRSFHVAGRGNMRSLCSSSHGAGRAMPRHVALKRISRHDLQRQMRGIWYDQRRADSLRDEAPDAYKDISRVMRAQRDLTRITRELRPLLVYKSAAMSGEQ